MCRHFGIKVHSHIMRALYRAHMATYVFLIAVIFITLFAKIALRITRSIQLLIALEIKPIYTMLLKYDEKLMNKIHNYMHIKNTK